MSAARPTLKEEYRGNYSDLIFIEHAFQKRIARLRPANRKKLESSRTLAALHKKREEARAAKDRKRELAVLEELLPLLEYRLIRLERSEGGVGLTYLIEDRWAHHLHTQVTSKKG